MDGGLLSRASSGGGDLSLDESAMLSDGSMGFACEEYSKAETEGDSPVLAAESSRLLDPFELISPTFSSGVNEGFAVRGSSSTSPSEINRIGGNLERPSTGRK